MATIIASLNYKGGVAKSTTAFNLAAALWLCGKRVLIVDADPQYELTTRMGFFEQDVDTLYDWLLNEGFDEIEPPIYNRYGDVEGFSFVPSSAKMSSIEVAFQKQQDRYNSPYETLRNCLKSINDDFDYIFIDCPPSPGFTNKMALIACDKVIIPVECAGESIDGLLKLESVIQSIKKRANPDLEVMGYLFTKYEGRTRITKRMTEEISANGRLFDTRIRNSVRFKEAGMYYMNIFEYEPGGNGSSDYMALAEELFGVKRPKDWESRSVEYWKKYIGSEEETSDNESEE